jgi:quinol monooxygenase YgiN
MGFKLVVYMKIKPGEKEAFATAIQGLRAANAKFMHPEPQLDYSTFIPDDESDLTAVLTEEYKDEDHLLKWTSDEGYKEHIAKVMAHCELGEIRVLGPLEGPAKDFLAGAGAKFYKQV